MKYDLQMLQREGGGAALRRAAGAGLKLRLCNPEEQLQSAEAHSLALPCGGEQYLQAHAEAAALQD